MHADALTFSWLTVHAVILHLQIIVYYVSVCTTLFLRLKAEITINLEDLICTLYMYMCIFVWTNATKYWTVYGIFCLYICILITPKYKYSCDVWDSFLDSMSHRLILGIVKCIVWGWGGRGGYKSKKNPAWSWQLSYRYLHVVYSLLYMSQYVMVELVFKDITPPFAIG